jgi:hypothetical protein
MSGVLLLFVVFDDGRAGSSSRLSKEDDAE